MLAEVITQTRQRSPLVHCITNYVSANDCANLLLACGASPIMADDPDEAAEVTRMCNGLVLNTGTPNPRKLDAMLIAGREANRLGHPVILDPVGVGCSALRREGARRLLADVKLTAIRGNASEIATLAQGTAAHRGVDSDIDCTAAMTAVQNARMLAKTTGAVVIVTGESDVVTDGTTCFRVANGHPMMRLVTGAGCQLSALIGAYVTADPAQALNAALAAVCAMGLCGEIAHDRLSVMDGSATYRNYIIDAISRLTPEALEKGARYEVQP